jgi:predicted transcriptional regulator
MDMGSLRYKIAKRLEKYLELDTNGIRNHILKVFLDIKNATVDAVYKIISKKYDVSHNVVASMVGYIHSKLGILRAHKESYKTPILYSLKEEYMELVRSIVNRSVTKSIST